MWQKWKFYIFSVIASKVLSARKWIIKIFIIIIKNIQYKKLVGLYVPSLAYELTNFKNSALLKIYLNLRLGVLAARSLLDQIAVMLMFVFLFPWFLWNYCDSSELAKLEERIILLPKLLWYVISFVKFQYTRSSMENT